MEQKKTLKANLERNRFTFLLIGMVITLMVILTAFQYKSFDDDENKFAETIVADYEEDMMEQTKRNEPPPPPPETPPQVLNIVEDDVEVEDEIVIDAEADDDTEVADYVPLEIDTEPEPEVLEIFKVVEQAPTFPGGEKERLKFLQKNIKYPQMARESGIQGKVFVTFVVEANGAISSVKILRGIGGGCDQEAVRVIKNMPKWKAGKQRGKPVRVQFNMPIKFTLSE